jgi:hypothetical protein
MFKQQTVFITGAGASWHYGYPTGERLVLEVIDLTKRYKSYCESRVAAGVNVDAMPHHLLAKVKVITPQAFISVWQEEIAECSQLIDRLQHMEPLVIDYFLGWNPPLHDLGRMMIAGSLLERESHGSPFRNRNREKGEGGAGADNWVRFIAHELLMGLSHSDQLLNNRVRFITFNYDNSLEKRLEQALSANNVLSREHISAFLAGGRIIHMYGALKDVPPPKREDFDALGQNFVSYGSTLEINMANALVDKWHLAAEEIQVIDPHTKDLGAAGTAAKAVMESASRIYFLGFAFDAENVKRLGLPYAGSDTQPRHFYFTNLGNFGAVNKLAADAVTFYPVAEDPGKAMFGRGHLRIERSVRNCYDALALDFGALSR